MAVPVDIYVQSDDTAPVPLAMVTVAVFDPITSVLVDQAETGTNGIATFLLPGTSVGRFYQIRLYRLGVVFGGARAISVQEPTTSTNKFDAFGTVLSIPVAVDSRLCRCTGRFVNFANKPIANCVVRISARAEYGFETPKIVDGNMVASEGMHFQTDPQGFLTIDLFRGGEYWITFAGEDDAVWPIVVPDRASANLINLIHPLPVSVNWTLGNDLSMAIGDTLLFPISLLFSNYKVVTTDLTSWIDVMNSDPVIVTVEISANSPNHLAITALAEGLAQVTAQPKPTLKPARVPTLDVLLPTLTVTVH